MTLLQQDSQGTRFFQNFILFVEDQAHFEETDECTFDGMKENELFSTPVCIRNVLLTSRVLQVQ